MSQKGMERPSHRPKLELTWASQYGRIAPYTNRVWLDPKEVHIEHIVSYSEAVKT